jgi:hypothetical protein
MRRKLQTLICKNIEYKPTRQKQKVFMGVTRNRKMETQQEQYTYLLIMRQFCDDDDDDDEEEEEEKEEEKEEEMVRWERN